MASAATDSLLVPLHGVQREIARADPPANGLLADHYLDCEDPTERADNVKGLGITLDPSYFICGPQAGVSYEQILKYVIHLRLRDTTKDELQVRVGQGEVEYGRLISRLAKHGYTRALSVDIEPMADQDQPAELRKIRLLLESLL